MPCRPHGRAGTHRPPSADGLRRRRVRSRTLHGRYSSCSPTSSRRACRGNDGDAPWTSAAAPALTSRPVDRLWGRPRSPSTRRRCSGRGPASAAWRTSGRPCRAALFEDGTFRPRPGRAGRALHERSRRGPGRDGPGCRQRRCGGRDRLNHATATGPPSTFWQAAADLDPTPRTRRPCWAPVRATSVGWPARLARRRRRGQSSPCPSPTPASSSGGSRTPRVGPAGDHVARLDPRRPRRCSSAVAELLPDGPFTVEATAWTVIAHVSPAVVGNTRSVDSTRSTPTVFAPGRLHGAAWSPIPRRTPPRSSTRRGRARTTASRSRSSRAVPVWLRRRRPVPPGPLPRRRDRRDRRAGRRPADLLPVLVVGALIAHGKPGFNLRGGHPPRTGPRRRTEVPPADLPSSTSVAGSRRRATTSGGRSSWRARRHRSGRTCSFRGRGRARAGAAR